MKKTFIYILYFILGLTIGAIPFTGCLFTKYSKAPYQETLRYNYYENEWNYAHPESELRYNYMENRWEFSK